MNSALQHTEGGTSPPDLDARIAAVHRALADLYEERAAMQITADTVRPSVVESIRIDEACKRMGWSYSWAVRRWEKLGGYKDLDGRLKIRCDVLSRHRTTPAKSGH